MTHKNLDNTHNTARYFVEHRQVSWAILIGVIIWGIWGYFQMPQRKDPEVPVRETVAVITWPGMPAEQVEQLVTKKVEERLGQNAHITEVRSVTRQGTAYVFAKFDEKVEATGRELDDLQQKLDTLQLPQGVYPVQLIKEFGDTATLMLTVASPPSDAVDLDLRAKELTALQQPDRVVFAWPHARNVSQQPIRPVLDRISGWMRDQNLITDVKPIAGPSFIGFDAATSATPAQLSKAVNTLSRERLQLPELHPDVWEPIILREHDNARAALALRPGPKYTYRELDRYTEQIEKAMKALGTVARVNRSGVLPEQVQLHYSQDRWAHNGISLGQLQQLMASRSATASPGNVDAQGREVAVVPQSDFRSADEVADVLIPTRNGSSTYIRDLADVERGYQTPAEFLNFFRYRDSNGHWQRARAITVDIQMRSGEQIANFDKQVSAELEKLRKQLPSDLVLDRTSDQPRQVSESVELFMSSLWEAVGLVVLVSLIGFWEWRSSLLMALAIPITLAFTFGLCFLLGVDLQQVSIASLIIALGLLVDDPVVAGDAIKRDLGEGRSRFFASWQGPTKLARAILYATITNIVAYLPFLLLEGDNRRFLYTLPVVMTCALVASRIVSMTFIPMLGYYLLKEKPEPTLQERRSRGFGAIYYKFGQWAIDHRWKVVAAFTILLGIVGWMSSHLKQQFFPFERQYLSYVDVWMPENASISATAETTRHAEEIIERVADQQGKGTLRNVTSWIGGGGPRYWISSNPEPNQRNYAHILIQVNDNKLTEKLLPLWQQAFNNEIPGATIDMRRLETSAPVGIPIQIRVSGTDLAQLREQAAKLESIMRSTPGATRVRNDWREDQLTANIEIDEARAALAGVSHSDIAGAVAGIDGAVVGSIRERDREIPIVMRQRMDERARAADLNNLYVYSKQDGTRVPLAQVAKLSYRLEPARISRYQQFRTITVQSFAQDGLLPSEVLSAAMPKIEEFEASLPAGMKLEIAGEYKEANKGNKQLSVVMLVSVLSIYFALVIQFRNAIKPFIVFAAIPFGIGGGLIGLLVMGAPFGFMAFLGVASLVGVIVSHIIVLFDFIEERHEEGAPLREALLDAGILRLRPVLITVGATVTALVPLAMRGGPLWEPLCYVQIGGLTLSTLVTLIVVPAIYAIFVYDLKLVKWGPIQPAPTTNAQPAMHMALEPNRG